jgi:hypothetical protein
MTMLKSTTKTMMMICLPTPPIINRQQQQPPPPPVLLIIGSRKKMILVTICLGTYFLQISKNNKFYEIIFVSSEITIDYYDVLSSDNFDIDAEKVASLEKEKRLSARLKQYDVKFVPSSTATDDNNNNDNNNNNNNNNNNDNNTNNDNDNDDDMFAGALLDPRQLAARELAAAAAADEADEEAATPLGAWEVATNGFGSRMLAKLGWRAGGGLGRALEGRARPVGIEGALGRNGRPLDETQCFGLGHYRRSKHGVRPPGAADDDASKAKRARNSANVFDFLNKSLGGGKRKSTGDGKEPAAKKTKTISELRSEVNKDR